MRREERGEIRSKKDLEHQGIPGASQPWGDLSESPWGSLTYWSQDSTSSGSDSSLLLSQPGIPDLVQPFTSQIVKVTPRRPLRALGTCKGCGGQRDLMTHRMGWGRREVGSDTERLSQAPEELLATLCIRRFREPTLIFKIFIESVQFSSVTQSCLTLCDPMNCSTPGFPVHHQLTELTQTHVHRVSDAIQPSHPLSSPSPPAFNLFQHQGLFQ